MIKINLNIKIDDLKLGEEGKDKNGFDISKNYINLAFTMKQRELDPQTRQPSGISMLEQRKIYKILDALDNSNKGIIELEDDMYNYLKKIFNDVKWVGGTKIVVRIADKIDEVIKEK